VSHRNSFIADDDVGVRIPYCSADKSIRKSRSCAAAKRSRARCFKVRVTPGVTRTLAGKDKLTSTTLLPDQRGAVAFEMPIVYLFMMLSLLLPLADVAIAGFQFVSAWGALRAFGQSIQYNQPPDVTNTSGWMSSVLAKADPGFPISNLQVICGDTKLVCSPSNLALPKYYSYTTTITLSPMVLRSVLCNANPCSFTLPYSERFQ
jgi:hypothetical protein